MASMIRRDAMNILVGVQSCKMEKGRQQYCRDQNRKELKLGLNTARTLYMIQLMHND